MKGDFEGASKFYDRVIRMDPAWSAFAHYNRAYCTIQMKGEGYIRRAIDDLKTTFSKLETYKKNCLFSEIHINASNKLIQRAQHDVNDVSNVRDTANRRSAQFHTMMKCQLFSHIETQITHTVERLKTIDTMKREVKTVQRDILDLIPGADSRTEQMLQEYRQLGLFFTYNIDVEPQFCYRSEIVCSLVMLESVADIILIASFNGTLVNACSTRLKDTIDAACSMKATGDESLGWMQKCVSSAIITGVNSIDFIRNVSSLVSTKQTELESSYKMIKETSQFTQFANSQATYILEFLDSLKQVNKLMSCQLDEILLDMTNVTMSSLKENIKQAIHEKIVPVKPLNRELYSLYDNVASNIEQFVDCICHLATFQASSSQLSDADFQTAELQNIVVQLMSRSLNSSTTATDLVGLYTPEITTAAAKIEIGGVIAKFSDFLCDKLNMFSSETGVDGHVCDDVEIFEVANKALISAWSDVIRGMIQDRITRSVMLDIQERTEELFVTMKNMLTFEFNLPHFSEHCSRNVERYKLSPQLSSRLDKYNNQMKKSRGTHVLSKTNARILSKQAKRNLIILDVDTEEILRISSHDIHDTIELIYNPPCPVYPRGHFDAYVKGKVVKAPSSDRDDYGLLYAAIGVARGDTYSWRSQQTFNEYIHEHPSDAGKLSASDGYANQLKLGRALLRLDMNHPTRQMNRCDSVELDSSHLFSCIQQALKSENVGRLAKVLSKYESASRSAEANSSNRGTGMMTSPVSRDAFKLFLSSGSSVETEVYRQLVVERINDGDITTALKLCCIGHQIPLGRDIMNINPTISDAKTIRRIFGQMLKMESYKQERSKFLSICDEWYTVLEPRGMMNVEQKNLLREWISTRQYANPDDPIVSLVLSKCSVAKKEAYDSKRNERR